MATAAANTSQALSKSASKKKHKREATAVVGQTEASAPVVKDGPSGEPQDLDGVENSHESPYVKELHKYDTFL